MKDAALPSGLIVLDVACLLGSLGQERGAHG